MYQTLLSLHSLVRWLVLISLLLAIYRAYSGWFAKRDFSSVDNKIRHYTATISHVQLVLGLWLYFISPIINYFLRNYKDAVKVSDVRFFGMEHSLMMFLAIIIITLGSMKTKRAIANKYKVMAIWFTIGLVIILVSIPWPFSPLASRAYFRAFN